MKDKKFTKIAKIFWFIAVVIVTLSMIAFLLIPLFR
jgi:hypothetical protein